MLPAIRARRQIASAGFWILCLVGMLALVLLAAGALGAAQDETKSAADKPKAGGVAPPDSLKVLERLGLKIVGNNLALARETELSKLLADVAKKKKNLLSAERDLHAVEAAVEELNAQIADFELQHTQLSVQMAQVSNTLENNRLVGALNTIVGQQKLALEQLKETNKRLKEAMSTAGHARDSYVELVLDMRTLADELSATWKDLATNPDLQEAVDAINAATGKKLKLSPAPSLVGAEKKIQTLEHTVLSETIPLNTEDGGLYVSVTIDGKHHCEMQVDSGAFSVTLPYKMAKEMGLEPKKDDRKIICSMADGSQVPATMIKIGSVRVGKFSVENVECAVFDEKATRASALLGMTFLGNFNINIDPQKSELRMVKIDSGDAPAKGKSAKGKSASGSANTPAGPKKKKREMDDS